MATLDRANVTEAILRIPVLMVSRSNFSWTARHSTWTVS